MTPNNIFAYKNKDKTFSGNKSDGIILRSLATETFCVSFNTSQSSFNKSFFGVWRGPQVDSFSLKMIRIKKIRLSDRIDTKLPGRGTTQKSWISLQERFMWRAPPEYGFICLDAKHFLMNGI